jgi:small subunit ribosomal protein S20
VANIKSQIKRNKQNEKARLRNKAVKSELKTAIRKFREAAEAGKVDDAVAAQRSAARKLDKAVSKGPVHAGRGHVHHVLDGQTAEIGGLRFGFVGGGLRTE